MSNNGNGFVNAWRKLNDVCWAPFVITPNIGLATANVSVGATARVAEQVVKAAGRTLGTFGKFSENFARRVANRGFEDAAKSRDLIVEALDNVTGKPGERSANELLSTTVIDRTTATAALPLFIAWDAALAGADDVEEVRDGAYNAWIALSRFLDIWASHGVLSGRISFDTDSMIRFGFFFMTTEGPLAAVARDFRGIVGGVAALSMGDFKWLSEASKDYWTSMEYVYDKWLADETQPENDFPIGPILARDGKMIIKRFPRPFVKALDTGDPREVVRELIDDAGEIYTMLSRYPETAFLVVFDVLIFVIKAWLEVSDALEYAICELALVESELSDEEKLEAEEKLRKTAGNATIEFEYYVPLVVPFDGTPKDQVFRRNVIGKVVNHETIAKSVFEQKAINRAQAITSEVVQLRAFLWLYGDEEIARKKSFEETARKFEEKAAERIRDNPLYPLTEKEIEELTKDGKRTDAQVRELKRELLRKRGLLAIADQIVGMEELSAEYRPYSADASGAFAGRA